MTLKELIGAGEYDLAAHRLLYGAVRARLGSGGRPAGRRRPAAAAGRADMRRRKETPDGG